MYVEPPQSAVRFPEASSDAGLAGYFPLELDKYIFQPAESILVGCHLSKGGVQSRERVRRLDWVRLGERTEQ